MSTLSHTSRILQLEADLAKFRAKQFREEMKHIPASNTDWRIRNLIGEQAQQFLSQTLQQQAVIAAASACQETGGAARNLSGLATAGAARRSPLHTRSP